MDTIRKVRYLSAVKYIGAFYLYRGVSSTVRRCREKATGKEYAVKVCDLTGAANNGAGDAHNVIDTARNEVNILRMCSQQKHIGTNMYCVLTCLAVTKMLYYY